MTAQATVAKSPTAAAIERLGKIDPPPDFGHMNELEPHLRAAVACGYELPGEVLALAAKGLHLAELTTAHVKPLEHRTVNVDRLLSGASTADILDADDTAATARTRWERAGELLIAAQGHLAAECDGVFGPIRDALIAGPMRDAVADLLKQAKSAAGKLQAFAPDYPPALLETANESELKVWRQSRQLQRDFDVLVRAWSTSWYQATCHRGRAGELGTQFNPSRPGGWFAWVTPDDVIDERLRSGHDVEVLRVASASSEHRLLSPGELMPLIAEIQATLPTEHKPAWQMVRHGVCDG
jgi:hypothetical protein